MTRVKKITASITFEDQPWSGGLPDRQDAIQALFENIPDDAVDFEFVYEDGTVETG